MKKIFLITALLLPVSNLQAQWKITGVDKSDNTSCSLVRISDTDSTTMVYGTVTNPDDGIYPFSTISRTASVNAGGEKYKLLKSVNLPIYDESTRLRAIIDGKGQKLNFILEFEKFPVKDGFDIIEKDSKHSEGTYNFFGIHIQPSEETDPSDCDSFKNEFPSVLYGDVSEEGNTELFYIAGDLSLSCTRGTEYRAGSTKPDYYFYVTLKNGGDRNLELDFNDGVWVTGHKMKGKEKEDVRILKLMRQKDCEDHFRLMDYREARLIVAGGMAAVVKDANQAANSTLNEDIKGAVGLFSLVSEAAMSKKIQDYMKEHPKERPSMLTSCTIKPGEKITGYVAVPTPKMDYEMLHIRVDGYEYAFKWEE